MTEQKPTALPVQTDGIPEELRALPQWLMWRYIPKTKPDGSINWAKVPFQINGNPAKSNDPTTWCSYDEAVDALYFGLEFDGLGFAFADDDGLFGIDLDDCRDPVTGELLPIAHEVLENVDGYAEVSPSGTGIKVFTRGHLDRARADKDQGIELYPTGRYFTVTGQRINGHDNLPTFDQDLSWFVEKYFGEKISAERAGPADLGTALELYKRPAPDWDIERVRDELLPYLDPDSGYSQWVNVGMAFHHQGSGDTEWLTLWDEWSAESGKYVSGECEAKWTSFNQQRGTGHGAITLASLIKVANEARTQEEKAARRASIDKWNHRVAAAPDVHELRDTVCAEIARDGSLDDVAREMVAQTIKSRFRALGTQLGIGPIRELIRSTAPVERRNTDDLPHWLTGWVYVNREDKFLHIDTKQWMTMQGFNAAFNRECIAMGMGGDDGSVSAARLALDHWAIPTADREVYLPGAGQFFDVDGLPCVNLYRPDLVPQSKDEMFWDDEDLLAVNAVKAHIDLLCGTDRAAAVALIEWLAHNVQNPGQKIRWSPLIKGIEGDGKSALGQLLQATMGHNNVTVVSPSVLMGQFNGWAEGHCVAVLEEVRIVGHNRFDALNAVKPIITNPITPIHRKGRDEYNIVNTTNVIGFTNHPDALPLDEGERRWMVVFTPFITRDELNAATGAGYFARLFNAIHDHASALRGWLMSVDVGQAFPVDGPAPMTRAKGVMVSLSASDDDRAAEDIIGDGALGVSKDVISSPHLIDAMRSREGLVLHTQRLNKLLVKSGYEQVTRIRWDGKPCRIWVRKGAVPKRLSGADLSEFLREMLDKTKQSAFDDEFLA